ncbi:hypothetical protein QOS04_27950 [Cupriavidus sp. LEh21]|nr:MULTISPECIES: hypothetical protein [unclassified Cupriavidus]MDK2660412.1 hypothetical protein [Cupriavidus sp. LEh21]
MELMLITWPDRCLRITGKAACNTFMTPYRFGASCLSKSDTESASITQDGDTGVVDDHVDPAKPRDRQTDGLFGLRLSVTSSLTNTRRSMSRPEKADRSLSMLRPVCRSLC